MNISPAKEVQMLAGASDIRLGFDGLIALAEGVLQPRRCARRQIVGRLIFRFPH